MYTPTIYTHTYACAHTSTHYTHVCYHTHAHTQSNEHKHTVTQALSTNIFSYHMYEHQYCVILYNSMASLAQHLFITCCCIHALVTMLFDGDDNSLYGGNSMLLLH